MSTSKGKTYEEIYGVEEAKHLKQLRSEQLKKQRIGKLTLQWRKTRRLL